MLHADTRNRRTSGYEASKKLRVRARAGVRPAGLERAARVPATAAALLRAKRAKQARLARAMRSDQGASKELGKYFASAHSALSQPLSAQVSTSVCALKLLVCAALSD